MEEENEQNIYSSRETLMEDGEISAEEDAFMQGYDEPEQDEEEAKNDTYEQAFRTRRRRRKQEPQDPFEEDDDYEPE